MFVFKCKTMDQINDIFDWLDTEYIACQFVSPACTRVLIAAEFTCRNSMGHHMSSRCVIYDKVLRQYMLCAEAWFTSVTVSGRNVTHNLSTWWNGTANSYMEIAIDDCDQITIDTDEVQLEYRKSDMLLVFTKFESNKFSCKIAQLLFAMRDHTWKLPFLESLIDNDLIVAAGLK